MWISRGARIQEELNVGYVAVADPGHMTLVQIRADVEMSDNLCEEVLDMVPVDDPSRSLLGGQISDQSNVYWAQASWSRGKVKVIQRS